MRTSWFTLLLMTALAACGRSDEQGSSLRDSSDQGDATFGVSINSDGDYQTTTTDTIAFADRYQDRGRAEVRGSLSAKVFDWFSASGDTDDAPAGDAKIAEHMPLGREAGGYRFDPAELSNALRTGQSSAKTFNYPTLAAARAAFDSQMADLQAPAEQYRQDVAEAAARLAVVINNSALAHNKSTVTVLASAEDILAAVAELERDGFLSDPCSVEGQRVRELQAYLNQIDDTSGGQGLGTRVSKAQLVGMARRALAMADQSYANGDSATGDAQAQMALVLADTALGFTPFVGTANDLVSAVFGVSLVGLEVQGWDRVASVVGVAASVVTVGNGSAVVRVIRAGAEAVHPGKILDTIRTLAHGDDAAAAVVDAERALALAQKAGVKVADLNPKVVVAVMDSVAKPELVLKALSSVPANVGKIRVFKGTSDEIAIIGRGTANVKGVEAALKAEKVPSQTFPWEQRYTDEVNELVMDNGGARLSLDQLKMTEGYLKNIEWIEKMKSEGKTILDIGDPDSADVGNAISEYYRLERRIVFGDQL